MFPTFLATLRRDDGTTVHRALCAHCEEEAARIARDLKIGTLVSVARREDPEWSAIEPSPRSIVTSGGETLVNLRYHFLDGGPLATTYRGRDYQVSAELYGEDRDATDEDGRAITAIGVAHFSCLQLPDLDHRVFLEPLDEQHAIDRLDGALIQLDADLDAIRGAAA